MRWTRKNLATLGNPDWRRVKMMGGTVVEVGSACNPPKAHAYIQSLKDENEKLNAALEGQTERVLERNTDIDMLKEKNACAMTVIDTLVGALMPYAQLCGPFLDGTDADPKALAAIATAKAFKEKVR